MGNSLAVLWDKIWPKREVRIVMLGLDAAGKTSILYRVKMGEIVTTIPTIGFNVETLEFNNVKLTVWDVRGGGKIQALWHHYFTGTQGLIFVLDSADLERFEESRETLQTVLHHHNWDSLAPVLIFANKQDLQKAMSIEEITEKLESSGSILKDRNYRIQPSSAITAQGINEGLEWLAEQLH